MAQAQLTIVVDAVPANTPASDPIHIAGDFQSWDPSSTAHALAYNASAGTHHITLQGVSGSVEFKFTRGSWATVESDANGQFIPNRTYTTSPGDTLYLQILGWEDLNGNGGSNSTAEANVTVMDDDFYISQLMRTRRIWVYLPPDYATSGLNYPVLYMHDGQNVFDASTSFAGEWEVDETLNSLHANGDAGVIVVAVDNGGTHRLDEYTPWVNATYGGGEGADYVDFLVADLKPYIDGNYRTLPGREHTGIMGSSLGGHISTYAGIEYQHVFSKIGALSPAYWINPEIYDHLSNTGRQQPMRIYQLGGSLEGASITTEMWAMDAALQAEGFGSTELLTVEHADGEHSEWYWAREFGAAYQWLYATTDSTTSRTQLLQQQLHVKAFPNPAKAALHVELEVNKPGPVRLELINQQGRVQQVVHNDAVLVGRHHFQLLLNRDRLPAGTYLLRATLGEVTATQQVVLQ